MAGTLRTLGLVLAGLAYGGASMADSKSMTDPMRPSGLAAIDPVQGSDAPANTAPTLQALHLRGHQPKALISGQWVVLGDSLAGARIVAIDERGVVLRRDGAVELLKLLPNFQSAPGTPSANKP